jgi:hypothetical protein
VLAVVKAGASAEAVSRRQTAPSAGRADHRAVEVERALTGEMREPARGADRDVAVAGRLVHGGRIELLDHRASIATAGLRRTPN